MPDRVPVSRFRQFSEERRHAFIASGLPARHVFAHRTYYLPKCGPDAIYLAQRMCGRKRVDGHVELLLFADAADIEALPTEMFFDDDLFWHRQQFGICGQVAFAYLFREGDDLYGLNYVSDLMQRISRRRAHATRVEKLFRGWRHMLFNSILNFAVEQGVKTIHSPTADLVIAHTDSSRVVKRPLFERIYDRTVTERFAATQANRWWIIDVEANRHRLVAPQKREASMHGARTICICHDVERGLGHTAADPARMRIANRIGPHALTEMIRCERAAGVRATYNVVGCFFEEVRAEIERHGHSLAFHSYDHVIRQHWQYTRFYWKLRWLLAALAGGGANGRYHDQLYRCRLVDSRVRGFRPPQSRITPEWNDFSLVYRNFDWLATSSRALGQTPVMQNHLAKIPIRLDDFPLYKSAMRYEDWEAQLLAEIERSDFIAFGLHDCYADLWLPHYRSLLEKLSRLGALTTLDAVADDTILAAAI